MLITILDIFVKLVVRYAKTVIQPHFLAMANVKDAVKKVNVKTIILQVV